MRIAPPILDSVHSFYAKRAGRWQRRVRGSSGCGELAAHTLLAGVGRNINAEDAGQGRLTFNKGGRAGHLVLMGDSNGEMYATALRDLAARLAQRAARARQSRYVITEQQ